jgi:hypothetical protein
VIRNFYEGQAVFSSDGLYLEPAPTATTGTAAWPTDLCKELVKAINVQGGGPLNNGLTAGVSHSIEAPLGSTHSPQGPGLESSLPPLPESLSTGFFPIEAPPENFWCGGSGPPRGTITFRKDDAFFDGCGLTSPGRWPRERRKFPRDKSWTQLRLQLDNIVGNDETVILKQMAILACHRGDLFCTSWVEDTRTAIDQWLGK